MHRRVQLSALALGSGQVASCKEQATTRQSSHCHPTHPQIGQTQLTGRFVLQHTQGLIRATSGPEAYYPCFIYNPSVLIGAPNPDRT